MSIARKRKYQADFKIEVHYYVDVNMSEIDRDSTVREKTYILEDDP